MSDQDFLDTLQDDDRIPENTAGKGDDDFLSSIPDDPEHKERMLKSSAELQAAIVPDLVQPLKFTDEMKEQVPEDQHEKIEDAFALSNGTDTPIDQVFLNYDTIKKNLADSQTTNWERTKGSFEAGTGDLFVGFGHAAKLVGMGTSADGDEPGWADDMITYGDKMRDAYIGEFAEKRYKYNFQKVADPEWWATHIARSVPMSVAIMPGAIAGAYAASGAAAAYGIGSFGTLVLGSIGASAMSAPMEASLEAGLLREELLSKGVDEDKADEEAEKVFLKNTALLGVSSVPEFISMFSRIKIKGGSAARIMSIRARAIKGTGRVGKKLTYGAGAEGFQERWQETFQMQAEAAGVGEEAVPYSKFFDFDDPRLNDAQLAGSVFGIGFGAAGSAYTALTDAVETTMDASVRKKFQDRVSQIKDELNSQGFMPRTTLGASLAPTSSEGLIVKGGEVVSDEKLIVQDGEVVGVDLIDQIARTRAFDEYADTSEGKAHIENVMEYLQNPDNSAPEVRVIGVEEDAEGNPILYNMIDQDGNEFSVPPGATPEQIESARRPDQLDDIIDSEEDVSDLIDETGQPLLSKGDSRARTEARNEELRGKKVSEMSSEEKDAALGDKAVGDMTESEKDATLLKSDVTGMPNRRSWNEFNSTDPHPVQIMFDLDGLKFANDFGGHKFGNEVLNAMADSLTESTVEGSRSHHFSGDEFAATAKDAEIAKVLLNKLHKESAKKVMTMEVDGHKFTFPITFGFGTDVNGNIDNADAEMNKAKLAAKAKGEVAERGEEPIGTIGKDPQGREMSEEEVAQFFEKKREEAKLAEAAAAPIDDVLAEEVRKGIGFTKHMLRAKLNKITKGWAYTGKAVQSIEDLPTGLYNFIVSKGAESSVQGVFDPETKNVYFVADNINKYDNLNRIALHEIIGHYGFETMVESSGDLTMLEVVNEIQRLKDEGNPVIMEAANEVADLYKGKIGPIVEAKEIVAHIAQRGQELPIIKRIIAAIKAFIKKTLGKSFTTKTSENDILYLIHQSSDFVRNTNELVASPLDVASVPVDSDIYKFSLQSPIWYSRLSNLILDFDQNKAPASAWKQTFESWIKKNKIPKALQEEIQWTGLLDALEAQGKTRLTKLEILNMIREGGVEIEEVVLSDALDGIFDRLTQYSHYALPGGTNYKELKLVLPHGDAESFIPSHFSDTPNLLVYVRFDERIIDGKRVLFINEIQSDWAKDARKGVKGPQDEITKAEAKVKELHSKSLALSEDDPGATLAFAKFVEAQSELNELKKHLTPDAPFIKSTNATTMLALKRVLKYAVDENFDSVAWPSTPEQVYEIEQWGEVQKDDAFVVEEEIGGSWNIAENIVAFGTDVEISSFKTKEEAQDWIDQYRKEFPDDDGGLRVGERTGTGKGFISPGGQDVSAIVNRYTTVLPKLVNEFLKKQMRAKTRVERIATEGTVGENKAILEAQIEEWRAEVGRLYPATLETPMVIGNIVTLLNTELESAPDFSSERRQLADLAEKGANLEYTEKNIDRDAKSETFNSIPLDEIGESVAEKGVPLFSKKKDVREATGVAKDDSKTISERKALFAAFKKAAQAARVAHRAGKLEEREVQKAIMAEKLAQMKESKAKAIEKIKTDKDILIARKKTIRAIQKSFGLTDNDLKKVSKKDIRLMSNWEFKKFKDDLQLLASQFAEHSLAKATLIKTIFDNRLQKVDNYRKSMGLPAISKMTTEQLNEFNDLIKDFHEDTFLTQRELETVEATDLKGVKTVNEARKRIAEEAGVSVEELSNIKVDIASDKFRWDTSLAEKNPFYNLLVTQMLEGLIGSELRVHEIESEVYRLAKASDKSRKRGIVGRMIPQDPQIMEYLEAGEETKHKLAEAMTHEQLDYAHYMQEYFGQSLEYLLKSKSLEKGVQNYFVHLRRTFLETAKDDGFLEAFKNIFKNYEQDQLNFQIMDDDTSNVLPLQKFFQYSLQRTGELVPTQNITKAFMTYVMAMEKKKALDAIIPKMSIYAQVLTPQKYTEKGLEMDKSLKKFVNEYINNKKGRRFSLGSILRQGGKADIGLTALRTFITMIDLGLNIPVGMASIVGEQMVTNVAMGTKLQAKGTKRMLTNKGKRIAAKYEGWIGRSLWEDLTAPGQEIGARFATAIFGFFHLSTTNSNKQFMLGMMTDEEWKNEELSDDRLAELRLEIGRWRKIPGSESLVGSTSIGKTGTQYKGWAIAPLRTVTKNLSQIVSDIKSLPPGEALSNKEAREIYRVIGLTLAVLAIGSLGTVEEDDDSFIAELRKKMYRESLTLLQALDPSLWIAVPRMMAFLVDLNSNLKSLLALEEYESPRRAGELKGATKLKKQFTPRAFKTFMQDKNKAQPLNP